MPSAAAGTPPPAVTRILAEFAAETRAADLPDIVRSEAARSFVNFVGCALGGARHAAVERTLSAARSFAGGPPVALIGRAERLGALEAALVNCQASAAHAYDDTHLATVTHPAGPIAAPLLAEAEQRPVDGEALLAAFAIGVEIACRVAASITVAPADGNVGWYPTGVACPIGAAAAVARLRGLDVGRIMAALGVAASQSAGFRQTHGSMCTSLIPGMAARAGYMAAIFAEAGVTCSEQALEGPRGFADVFAPKAWLPHATDGLGARWEMLANMAKPYPCGIVIHPALDGCLAIAATDGFDPGAIRRVELGVNPLCLVLCDRPAPPDGQRAQVSLQHWAAAALARGQAGVAEGSDAAVADPAVLAVRAKIAAMPDESVGRDGAVVRVLMADGSEHARHIAHGIGSLERPMTDPELDAKFLDQARLSLSEAAARSALTLCRRLPELADVGEIARATQAGAV